MVDAHYIVYRILCWRFYFFQIFYVVKLTLYFGCAPSCSLSLSLLLFATPIRSRIDRSRPRDFHDPSPWPPGYCSNRFYLLLTLYTCSLSLSTTVALIGLSLERCFIDVATSVCFVELLTQVLYIICQSFTEVIFNPWTSTFLSLSLSRLKFTAQPSVSLLTAINQNFFYEMSFFERFYYFCDYLCCYSE